jgi:hypothetical protein
MRRQQQVRSFIIIFLQVSESLLMKISKQQQQCMVGLTRSSYSPPEQDNNPRCDGFNKNNPESLQAL